MRKTISNAMAALCVASTLSAAAGGIPEVTEITPNNAAPYGIEVAEEPSAREGERSFRIHFPAQISSGCSIGRVQTAVFDSSGRQISISSFDASQTAPAGSLVVSYGNAAKAVSVGFQYCCSEPGDSCQVMLSIESLEGFSHNKSLKYVPALSGLHRTQQSCAA